MDPKIADLLLQGGLAGIITFISWKVITKLYNNLREDRKEQLAFNQKQLEVSQAREDRLMEHLEKSNQSLSRISQTLDNIGKRISEIEICIMKK